MCAHPTTRPGPPVAESGTEFMRALMPASGVWCLASESGRESGAVVSKVTGSDAEGLVTVPEGTRAALCDVALCGAVLCRVLPDDTAL